MWEVEIHINATKPKLWRLGLDGVSGFQLVHLMLLGERDSLPLGLSHNVCAMCLSFGDFVFWLCAEGRPWRQPTDSEV